MTTAVSKSVSLITNNALGAAVHCLKRGHYLVLHDSVKQLARCFHQCSEKKRSEEGVNEFFKTRTVFYVDVALLPNDFASIPGFSEKRNVLDDGEWNWYLKNKGFKECSCNLKERATLQHQLLPRIILSVATSWIGR